MKIKEKAIPSQMNSVIIVLSNISLNKVILTLSPDFLSLPFNCGNGNFMGAGGPIKNLPKIFCLNFDWGGSK